MGYFDLPTGELELQLKDKNGVYWESVMFTDWIEQYEIAQTVERWSEHHEVLAARYNGKPVAIPTNYHWELVSKGEVLGSFATRKEAEKAREERKAKWVKDRTVKIGLPEFVKD